MEISVQDLPKRGKTLAKRNAAECWTAVSGGIKDALERFWANRPRPASLRLQLA